MKLKLSDWLGIRWEYPQCMDVIAQLLALPRETAGQYLNPEDFTLEFSEEDPGGFGELRAGKHSSGFAKGYTPPDPLGTEADDVFVTGLMLYRLLTGKLPDLGMAQFLKVKVHGQQQVPLLHVPQSTLGPLLEEMTDLNPATRITRQAALDRLAALWKGSAAVLVTEETTGCVLETLDVALTQGNTVWRSAEALHYGDLTFSPSAGHELQLPFRVKKQQYSFPVQAQSEETPSCTVGMPQLPVCAVDLGADSVRLLHWDTKGHETIQTIAPVCAFRTRDELVFGAQAELLCRDGKTIRIPCTDVPASDKKAHFLAADGTGIQFSPRAASEAFTAHLLQHLREMGLTDQAPLILAFPTGWDASARSLWLQSFRNAGCAAAGITATSAALLCRHLSEPLSGHVMVVDAGAGSLDVCLFDCGEAPAPETLARRCTAMHQSFSAPGGREMTDLLVRDMLQTLNLHHGLSLYNEESSRLNAAQFAHDRFLLLEAAERIKCTLSFAEQAEAALQLYNGTSAPLEISVRYTRSQLLSLLTSVSRGVRQAMQQACADGGITREQTAAVLVTGAASLCPAIRQEIAMFFQNTDCRILYTDCRSAVVRGAAFRGALENADTAPPDLTLPYDLGVITGDAVQQLPEFHVLFPAGTPLQTEAVCTFPMHVTQSDLDAQGSCQLRLYTRQRGMEHVRSTLDPEGSCIRILGKLVLRLPEEFQPGSDQLQLQITLRPDETVTAQADIVPAKKSGLFGSLLGGKRPAAQTIPAQFKPLS